MLLGRLLLGLGAESYVMANFNIVSKWFRGKELGLAMGIILATSSLYSNVNSFLTPKLFNRYNSISIPLFVGVISMVLSLLSGLVVFCIDLKADKRAREAREGAREKNDEA